MRMLFRTPAKSLVTFVLIAAVTFGFSSQVFEYAVVSREMAKLADYFRITGTIEAGPVPPAPQSLGYPNALFTQLEPSLPQYTPVSAEAMAAIAAYPQVAATSTRYMSAGISDEYYRIDSNMFLYNYVNRFVGEGIIEHAEVLPSVNKQFSTLSMTFSEFNLLAGNPAWLGKSKVKVKMLLSSEQGEGWGIGLSEFRAGVFSSPKHTPSFAARIQPGERVLFLGKVLTEQGTNDLYVGDVFADYWCDMLCITTDEPDDYLQTEAFEKYRLAIDISNADIHTFDMVYTDDMMNIPRFADRLITIHQGRALTAADSGTKNCVVSERFLYDNKLEIGNTITMKLGDKLFEQNAEIGTVAAVPDRYKEPVTTEELTIVGSYLFVEPASKQAEELYHNYNLNTIFVSKTLLPQSADNKTHAFKPGEFSFVLDHPNNLESFLSDTVAYLNENGLKLVLGKNGDAWAKISGSFNSSTDVNTLTIGIFLLAEMAVAVFVVYLYISRRKREYAIMRVHGVTGKKAGNALFIPFMLLGLFAVIVGTSGAFVYTTRAISDVLAQYPAVMDYTYSTEVPPLAAAGCVVLATLLLAMPALLILRKLRSTPPLMLLQDNQGKKTKKIATVKTEASFTTIPLALGDAVKPMEKKTGFAAASRHVLSYVARHSRRTLVKSLLSLLVPALLFAVIGQLVVLREEYKVLFETMTVTGSFTEKAPAMQVLNLSKKPYLKDNYYIGQLRVRIGETDAMLILTNNFEKYTDNDPVTYADEFDATAFDFNAAACVVSDNLMTEYTLAIGGEVTLVTSDEYNLLLGKNTTTDEETEKEIINFEQFASDIEKASTAFKIIGTTAFKSAYTDLPVILARPGDWYWFFAGVNGLFDQAEFTLADNTQANLFKEDGEKSAMSGRSTSPHLEFAIDLAALENVKRINEIMVKLFPLILAALALIGGFFQVLMISQLSKDAARLRLLGTPPARVCAMLALERLVFLLVGFGLSLLGLFLFNGDKLGNTAETITGCAALFLAVNILATLIISFTVSKRNPLKSIQAKE